MLKRTFFLLALLLMTRAAFAEDSPGGINLQISEGEAKVGSVVQFTPFGGTPPYTLSITSPR